MRNLLQKSLAVFSVVVYLASAQSAYAADSLCPKGWESLCTIKGENLGNLTGGIITVILILAILACLCFLVLGGIRWTMSTGDQAKIGQARSMIIAALVGLVIAFLAFAIANVILYMFTGQGLNGLTIPKLV